MNKLKFDVIKSLLFTALLFVLSKSIIPETPLYYIVTVMGYISLVINILMLIVIFFVEVVDSWTSKKDDENKVDK